MKRYLNRRAATLRGFSYKQPFLLRDLEYCRQAPNLLKILKTDSIEELGTLCLCVWERARTCVRACVRASMPGWLHLNYGLPLFERRR